MVSTYKVASILYRELSYQSYTASRISGLRPMNIRRAVKVATYNKLVLSILVGFYVGVMGVLPYIILKRPILSLMETMASSFFIVFASSINIVYSLQQIDYIRNLLATLPLEPDVIRRALALSLFMTMDTPIYVAIAISVLISLIMGGLPYPLLGVAQGISLGIIVSMGFILISERVSKNPLSKNLTNALSVILVMLASMAVVYSLNVNPSGLNPILSFMPITSGLFINGFGTPLYLTIIYIIMFTALAYLMLKEVSRHMFEYIAQQHVVRVKLFRGFKVTNPFIALIKVDLIQSFRSRIAGLWALPIGYWLIMVLTMGMGHIKMEPALMITYTMELSAMMAFIPYALYMSELRGAVVFKLLPISTLKNLASKLLVTLLAYYIAVAPISIMALVYGLPPDLQAPILMAFGPPMAATAVMANLFERAMREGAISSVLLMLTYALIVLLVEGLPIASFIVAHLLIGGYVIPSLIMLSISMLEFLIVIAKLLLDTKR